MTGNSILSSTSTAIARKVFIDYLIPIAEQRDIHEYFAGGPDDSKDTYFNIPSRSIISREEMFAIDERGEFSELEALWHEKKHKELLVLIEPLKDIYEALTPDEVMLEAEPSELIYALY